MKKMTLKAKKDAAVRRFHPWVFSGAVAERDADITDGEVVEVFSHRGDYLATGHFQDGRICVRLFSFERTEAGQNFWNDKIFNACQYRRQLNLVDQPDTNCFRLVHGEGDGLPGLIVDVYGKTAVVQCRSIGMHREREAIARALLEAFNGELKAIYDKSQDNLPRQYAAQVQDGYLHGNAERSRILENGHSFWVDWESGQKTGFFLDQRDNRALLARYARDQRVLNAFCYTGGFSVYALAADAAHVDSVDISQQAIDLAIENVALNHAAGRHRAYAADVLQFLKESDEAYDVMVVDPPAFAKNISKRHKAVQGYKRLNALALRKIKKGGTLFTFSCSQVVDRQLFYDTIVAAAIEARRRVRVMHHLAQPADHPASLFHPEGSYLKGLVVFVE